MQADSSPIRWMWGFRMVVCTGLLFRDHTGGATEEAEEMQPGAFCLPSSTLPMPSSPLSASFTEGDPWDSLGRLGVRAEILGNRSYNPA